MTSSSINQPASEITYLLAYYLLVSHYAMYIALAYVRLNGSYANVYTPCRINGTDRLNR